MKKIYLLFGGVCTLQASIAQPVLNGVDINPIIGETMTLVNGAHVSEGSSGNNVTWDLSGITGSNYSLQIQAPSGATPNANVDYNTAGQAHTYQENSTTGQKVYYQLASSVLITYSDPIQLLSFPLSMSTNYTDNFAATFTSQSFPFSRVGTVNCVADGYGTLITPAGTFTDVLRVVITQEYTDTYSGGTLDYEVVTYAWYKAGYHYALASCVELTTFQGYQEYSDYLQAAPLGLNDVKTKVALVYPNPVEDNLFIDFKGYDVKEYELYTSAGNLVRTSNGNLSSIQQVSMSDLEKGVYFLRFTEGENRSTIKVVKQ